MALSQSSVENAQRRSEQPFRRRNQRDQPQGEWSIQGGGRLSLSDRGVLYVVMSNGRVMAINLR